jgi:tetratricopeptide (TPR) repeat protein
LFALARLVLRDGQPKGGRYRPECYFVRARVFAPDDPVVYEVYGYLLAGQGKKAEAVEFYERALSLDDGRAEAHYNLGLLYLDLGNVPKAQLHADRAYQLGYPLPGLRNRLQKASTRPGTDVSKPTSSPAASKGQ